MNWYQVTYLIPCDKRMKYIFAKDHKEACDKAAACTPHGGQFIAKLMHQGMRTK